MPIPDGERLAVCSWSLQPESIDELVELVAATGLTRVQLALDPLRTMPERWADAEGRLDAAGIRTVSGMIGFIGEDYSTLESIRRTGGVLPDEHWTENQRNVVAAIKAAIALGLSKVSTHVGFIAGSPGDEIHGKMVERVRWLADQFAEAHLTLLLETGQETAAHLQGFLDVLERENVAVNFDPANMILYGKGDPVAALNALLPRVAQVHVKDALGSSAAGQWGVEVPVGEGQVDWPSFFEVLNSGGYRRDLVIEREAGDSRVADIVVARERTSLWLKEC